jgi:[protein-PII] uridylyltransferase
MPYSTAIDQAGQADDALAILEAGLKDLSKPVSDCRQALERASENLNQRFMEGAAVTELVRLRSDLIDFLLTRLWRHYANELAATAALIAVGGYGRGELHPFSDIDIMVLTEDDLPQAAESALSEFFMALWDIGLEIGHSVRTVSQCCQESADDITIATTLLEARLISGPEALFEQMKQAMSTAEIWPSDRFFEAKRAEQRSLAELVAHHFLTSGQLRTLQDGQAFLWRVRYGLHVLTGRREDRLLFDHQARLATMLGYEDASYTLAVEQLMQRYYRTVMDLSRLNEMLLQLFEEEILMDPHAEPKPINERFQVKNGYLQTINDHVFSQDPSALLELFLLLQQHSDLRGVSAFTVGLIRRNLYLIDEEFRQNPRNHRLFLSILRAPAGVTHELRRMNLYGVLGLYIPSFGRIVGRMQYDLFHTYTVDEHTMFVVSNLRRFALSRFDHEYPHCSPLMQSFEKPEIVYLAGLFHDIAKGRGGDHSELGAVDAEAFCLYYARTVAWLVKHHLALSMTAQKKDLGDPEVINGFAALVGDHTHLDYLYVLTVADVRGTNPKLWNSWKATLFRDLYELTAHALRRGLENPIDREQLISETQASAREILRNAGTPDDAVDDVWKLFTEDYFLRYRSEEIAWHTELLAESDIESGHGLLDVRKQADGDRVEAVLYTPHTNSTFAYATAILAELGMTIVDARIVPIANDFSLHTYIFMELEHRTVIDDARLNKIRRTLTSILTTDDTRTVKVTRRAPRQVRMFSTKTVINFDHDISNKRTVMELNAGDRPGLLSIVGQTFIEFRINIETAKIMTIGERAEDVFYIVDENNKLLSDEVCDQLRDRLVERLDDKP